MKTFGTLLFDDGSDRFEAVDWKAGGCAVSLKDIVPLDPEWPGTLLTESGMAGVETVSEEYPGVVLLECGRTKRGRGGGAPPSSSKGICLTTFTP